MSRSSKSGPILITIAALAIAGAGVWVLLGTGGTGGGAAKPEPGQGGQPVEDIELARLDRAIERGVDAFLRGYVAPSWEHVSNGGYVDYTDAVGVTKTYGPDVYVACEIYLLTHYAMYYREFGAADDDPTLVKVRAWLVDKFDTETGKWIWSDEGCLHPKGMIALALMDRRDLVDKAWAWARNSDLWRPDSRMFTMKQSGDIIQTLGNPELSLSGRYDWEHGSPIPDAENSSKFLFAMLLAGHSLDDPEVSDLYRAIDRYFETNPLTFMDMDTRDVIGMAWFVFCHHRFDLPRGTGYDFCIRTMTEGVGKGGQLQKHGLTEHFSAVRGLVIKALMLADATTPAIPDQIRWILARQDAAGTWALTPAARRAWGLDVVPVQGMRMGQMDGANTYLTTLTLISFREKAYGIGGAGLIPTIASGASSGR